MTVTQMAGSDRIASLWNRLGAKIVECADRLALGPAVAVGVMSVECGGVGMIDDRAVIRFEAHHFVRHTAAKADAARLFRYNTKTPWLQQQHFVDSDGDGARDSWKLIHPGDVVGNQPREWRAFDDAAAIDRVAAIRSTSYGLGQILGANHEAAGYESPEQYHASMNHSEAVQVEAFFRFIENGGGDRAMVVALRDENWVAFASRYNGAGQPHHYADLISSAVRTARRRLGSN